MSRTNDTLETLESLDKRYANVLNMLGILPDALITDVSKRMLPMSEREFVAIQTYLSKALKSASMEIDSLTFEGVMEYRKVMK